jgi:hypothetical protein
MWKVLILLSGSAAGSLIVLVLEGGVTLEVEWPSPMGPTDAIVRKGIAKDERMAGRVAAKSREVVRRAAIVGY